MKKSDLRHIIREEIRNALLKEIAVKVLNFPNFPYLFKKTNKAVKVDLSADPEISRMKDIKHVFVVVKRVSDGKVYYQVYYQPFDTSNPDYWESGHQGKTALQSQLINKIIKIAKPHL